MAYTKKTTTKKTAVKATPIKPDPIEIAVPFEEEAVLFEEKIPKKEKRVFHADDMILCRSVTVGKLVLVGQTNNTVYRWMNYGDEIEIEYRDLSALVRAHSPYVYTPYFIVEDEDFIAEFRELDKFYKEKFTISELTDILRMNEGDMEDAIAVLPKGAKEQFVNLASTQISTGELDSVRKIKVLERILGVDFSLVAGI